MVCEDETLLSLFLKKISRYRIGYWKKFLKRIFLDVPSGRSLIKKFSLAVSVRRLTTIRETKRDLIKPSINQSIQITLQQNH